MMATGLEVAAAELDRERYTSFSSLFARGKSTGRPLT
jgi:hypothetical protein